MDLYREFESVRSELAKITELLHSQMANSRTMKMYDLSDLQQLLNVSRRTISTWTKEGTLPHSKKGNKIWVTEEQFNAFLEQHSNQTGSELKIKKGRRNE